MWQPHEEGAPHVEWFESMRDGLRPYETGGVYVNALGGEGAERVQAAYGANWARLVELKRRWDPENALRLNAKVDPSARPV